MYQPPVTPVGTTKTSGGVTYRWDGARWTPIGTASPPGGYSADHETETIQSHGGVDQFGMATGTQTISRGGSTPGGGGVTKPRTPGLLDAPGTGESWYEKNKGRWNQPRNASQYWNGMRGSRPNATSTNWGYVSGQLRNQGGAGRARGWDAANIRNVANNSQPGMSEDYSRNAAGYFAAPGEMEWYYRDNKDFFGNQGTGESFVRNNMGGFQREGVAETNYGNVRGALKGNNRTAGYFDDTKGYGTGASAVDDERGYFSPSLRDKSYSEKMYETGSGGLIDPYARAQEKQTRQMRNVAASRGMFGTGASLRLEEELGRDIAAEEARDRIALAEQADSQRLGRAGAALDFASEAEQARLGRLGFGLEASMGADESTRQNLGLETDAAKTAQAAMIDRLFKGGELGLMADDRALNRIMGGGEMADKAQGRGLDRVKGGSEVMSRGQEDQRKRIQDQIDAWAKSAGIETDADRSEREGLDAIMRGAGDVDRQFNADDAHDFNQARLLDEDERAWLESEQTAAYGAQGAMEGREGTAYDRIAGNARTQAGAVGGSLSEASTEDREMAQDVINTIMQQFGLTAQQAERQVEELYQAGKLAAAYAYYKKK